MTTATQPSLARKLVPWVFTLTAFYGAALIFMVQPLVAKLLLPSFGGAATVWTTSNMFFQVALLLGYILVHGTVRFGGKVQTLLWAPLVGLSVVLLPIALPLNVTVSENPILWLVTTLSVMVGLPFLVLSTTGPLIQKWYSWSGAYRADDPYFLYAASNIGSFLGLLSYPFLVETNFALQVQQNYWSYGFFGFAALLAVCAVLLWLTVEKQDAHVEKAVAEKLTVARQAKWVWLAFMPSTLSLGVTSYITTDLASIPLLWVIPLGLYLATMIVAFGSSARSFSAKWTAVGSVVAAGLLAVILMGLSMNIYVAMSLLFVGFTLLAFVFHKNLAVDRPSTAHLTRFYVWVSLGGALGGVVNGVVAPLLFPGVWELQFALIAVPLLLLVGKNVKKSLVFATSLVMLGTFSYGTFMGLQNSVFKDRTFYNSYKVDKFTDGTFFVHGNTIHGTQVAGREDEPSSYYVTYGPLGDIFGIANAENTWVVGLGIGVLAAYGEPHMDMTMVEIDPLVIDIAKNEDFFTYLSDSKAGNIDLVAADGRLALHDEEDGAIDLLLLDAFNSDSIPIHVITENAFKEYDSKMADDGVIAMNITNRVFNLEPVLSSNAQAIGARVFIKTMKADGFAARAKWSVMVKDEEKIAEFEKAG